MAVLCTSWFTCYIQVHTLYIFSGYDTTVDTLYYDYYKFEFPFWVALLPAGGLSTCPFDAAATFLISTGDFLGTLGDCLPSRGLAGLGVSGKGAFPPVVRGLACSGTLFPTPLVVPKGDSFRSLTIWNYVVHSPAWMQALLLLVIISTALVWSPPWWTFRVWITSTCDNVKEVMTVTITWTGFSLTSVLSASSFL